MRIGSSMATRRVTAIICGVGAKRAVAQLSSSYHAMESADVEQFRRRRKEKVVYVYHA